MQSYQDVKREGALLHQQVVSVHSDWSAQS